MKSLRSAALTRQWAGLCSGGFSRVGLGTLALALAATQLACTDPVKFSSAAALSTIAPADWPIPAVVEADFGAVVPSTDVRSVAKGVLLSRDHADADFIIIDKKGAMVYVFDANGTLRGASPVLLGSAVGDETVPGIGLRPIAQVLPEERTTPAGRFIAERGRNTLGEDVVWVDYDAAVSMHRVRTTNPKERRLERLATPTADDNRISYGCINVPVAFYEGVVAPTFAAQRAIVYVLPDVKPMAQVFNFYAGLAKN